MIDGQCETETLFPATKGEITRELSRARGTAGKSRTVVLRHVGSARTGRHVDVRTAPGADLTIRVESGTYDLHVRGSSTILIVASSAFGNVVSAHDQASVTVEVASGRKFTGRVDGRARMTVRAEAGARGIVFAYGTGMPGVDGSSHTVELVQNQ